MRKRNKRKDANRSAHRDDSYEFDRADAPTVVLIKDKRILVMPEMNAIFVCSSVEVAKAFISLDANAFGGWVPTPYCFNDWIEMIRRAITDRIEWLFVVRGAFDIAGYSRFDASRVPLKEIIDRFGYADIHIPMMEMTEVDGQNRTNVFDLRFGGGKTFRKN